MSKINPLTENTGLYTQTGVRKGADTAFGEHLNRAMDRQGAESSRAADRPELVDAPRGSVPVFTGNEEGKARVMEKTADLLDLMETYARDLEDEKKSLRDMEPLIRRIDAKAVELMEDTNASCAEEDGLGGIARQCAMTARGEYLKFQRGDYV